MKGEIIYARQWLQTLKPVVQERTGITLDEIVVKSMREFPWFSANDYSNVLMFVNRADCCKNAIFVNGNNYKEKGAGTIPLHVAHELSHLIHYEIIKEQVDKIRLPIYERWKMTRYENESFMEGFAEYLSIDYLAGADSWVDRLAEIRKRKFNLYEEANYIPIPKPVSYRGYKFFEKVLDVIGKDKVLEVARAPPLCELEMKNPLLYILRRYPIKGIRNIPKFAVKDIREKMRKRNEEEYRRARILKKGETHLYSD